MYKLNTESAAAKFYEWVWKTDVTEFKTMCPYFWKYVLTIIFIPVILLCKGIYYILPKNEKVNDAFNYIENSRVGDAVRKVTKPNRFWDIVGNIFKWVFFILIGAGVTIMVVALAIAFWSAPMEGLSVIGITVILVGVVLGLIYVFDEYKLVRKISSPFRLFGNMISSLYHKVCPLINWN